MKVQLTDKEIRAALLEHLRSRPVAPKAVLEEVRVHNGNAIADVVAVHSSAHCYEIKGETDAIRRIVRQGAFYDQAFQRITLVTTENHLQQVDRLAPAHWGVMVAGWAGSNTPKLRYLRKATDSPKFDKQTALLTLWKSELLSVCVADEESAHKLSRLSLTRLIADKKAAREISTMIGEMLANRQINNGWSVAI